MKDTYSVTLNYARRIETLEIKTDSWLEVEDMVKKMCAERLESDSYDGKSHCVLYDIVCPDNSLVFGTVFSKLKAPDTMPEALDCKTYL